MAWLCVSCRSKRSPCYGLPFEPAAAADCFALHMVPKETSAVAEILLSDLCGQVSISFIASLQLAEAGPGLLNNLLASNLIVHTQHLWGCVHSKKTWEILSENGQEGRSTQSDCKLKIIFLHSGKYSHKLLLALIIDML